MFNGFFKNDDHLIGRFGAAEKRKLPDAELSVRENPDMDKESTVHGAPIIPRKRPGHKNTLGG